ncbi:MAG: hypothetical protein H6Q90_3002 [Deltaproteobacteria bacterium]|nr:hypothetical protein [Deltaproteobacteria bacterium]
MVGDTNRDDSNHDDTWLLARERGENVSHVPAETRATYDRLQELMDKLPDEAPSLAWKQRVLAAIDAPAPAVARRASRWRPRLMAAGGLAAATMIALVIIARRGPSEPEPGFSTEIRRSEHAHRGGAVAVDDTLVIHAQARATSELRVYDDAGDLLAQCGEHGGDHCKVERNGDNRHLTLELVLSAPGGVRSVLYVGGSMPAARNLNADQDAALRAHIATFSRPAIQVE